MCDLCFSILLDETGSEWAEKIRHERFTWHNQQWLRIVEMQEVDGLAEDEGMEEDEEDDAMMRSSQFDLFDVSMCVPA